MAFYSGFFNSKGLDRTYTAEDFTTYLSSIICNGILDTYGDCFSLTAASTGLKVILGRGKAWINGHYFVNDSRYSIDLTEYQDESLPRYVSIAIVCDTSESVRAVRLEIVPGTPAENPALPVIPTDEKRTRLLLYAVRLNVGAASLSKFDWYDYREDSNVCGYCRCILGKCKVSEIMDAYDKNNRLMESLQEQIGELSERVSGITGEIVDIGQIGKSAYYTQYSDGTLSISGNGTTNDYTGFAIQLGYTDEPDSPFYENEAIQKVKLSNGITALGNWLFAACRNLENIVLPRNLERIGDLTFNRTAIKSIEFPTSLTTIGVGAFTASKLENVYIPATVKNFGRYAFFHCESLKSVNIQCEKTGSVAFSGCISLTSVTIGTGCKYIADSSFVYCDNLREITYIGTLAQWAEVGKGHLWDGHGGVSESVLERIQCTDGFMEYDYENSVWKEVKN